MDRIEKRICIWCGKKFTVDFGKKKWAQKYCSDACAHAAKTQRDREYQAKMKAEREANRAGRVYERTCIACGKTFQTDNYRVQICSEECQKKRRQTYKSSARQRSADYRERKKAEAKYSAFKSKHNVFIPTPGDQYDSYMKRQVAETMELYGRVILPDDTK